jgi:hypothetical protein
MLSLLLMLWMLRLLRRAMSAVGVLVWIHIVTVEMVGI